MSLAVTGAGWVNWPHSQQHIVYNSAEAFFQAQKYNRRSNRRNIKSKTFAGVEATPRQAKFRGGRRGGLGMTIAELKDWTGHGDGDANARVSKPVRCCCMSHAHDRMI